MTHYLNLLLSTETWSGFLGWWQGSMTKPLKVLQTLQLAALDLNRPFPPESLSLAVCSPCSGDGALCYKATLPLCGQWKVFFPSRVASNTSMLSHEQTNLHTSLYTVSSCTGCWDSFVDPDFADCLSNESKQTR